MNAVVTASLRPAIFREYVISGIVGEAHIPQAALGKMKACLGRYLTATGVPVPEGVL